MFRCWAKDDSQRPSMEKLLRSFIKKFKTTFDRKLSDQIEQFRLQIIAEDSTKSEEERVTALIRFTGVWGSNIGWEHLRFIRDTIMNTNKKLESSILTIADISRSYKHRLELIESIPIDREKCRHEDWLNWYAYLLSECFLRYIYYDEHCTNEFEREIRHQICQLIVEKMNFILSDDQIWMTTNRVDIDYRIIILNIITHLLTVYRIKMKVDDLQTLKKRFAETINIDPQAVHLITGIVHRINYMEQAQILQPQFISI